MVCMWWIVTRWWSWSWFGFCTSATSTGLCSEHQLCWSTCWLTSSDSSAYGYDFPGRELISFQLTSINYLAWCHSMRIALGANDKLKFIDGLYHMPMKESPDYTAWMKISCLLSAWTLNVVAKEIARSFIYVESSHTLRWDSAMRFGESNGSLVYHLKHDIITNSQVHEAVVFILQQTSWALGWTRLDFTYSC